MNEKPELYYIYNYASPEGGEFGTRDECMRWYLKYDGGDYRVTRNGGEWECAVKDSPTRDDRFHTVCCVDGENEDEAETAFFEHLWKTGLPDNFHVGLADDEILWKLSPSEYQEAGIDPDDPATDDPAKRIKAITLFGARKRCLLTPEQIAYLIKLQESH